MAVRRNGQRPRQRRGGVDRCFAFAGIAERGAGRDCAPNRVHPAGRRLRPDRTVPTRAPARRVIADRGHTDREGLEADEDVAGQRSRNHTAFQRLLAAHRLRTRDRERDVIAAETVAGAVHDDVQVAAPELRMSTSIRIEVPRTYVSVCTSVNAVPGNATVVRTRCASID